MQRRPSASAGPVLAVLYLLIQPIVVQFSFQGPAYISSHVLLYLLFAAAIALAGRLPLVSLAIVVLLPLAQARLLLPPVYFTDLYLYAALFPVAFVIGLTARGVLRYVSLGAGVLASLIVAYDVIIFGRVAVINRPNGEPLDPLHPRWLELGALTPAIFGVFAAAWVFGVAIAGIGIARTLRATESRLEERDLELRLSEDRARIARDVHDALAHSLTVVVSQAEGGLAVHDARPDLSRQSLTTIASVGRTALVDVRRLVERIHDHDVVASRLTSADLGTLVAEMQGVGMHVTLLSEGESRILRTSQDVAVYRIVQESLTNTLKHAGTASTAVVTLAWEADELRLSIVSSGDAPIIDAREGGVGIGIAGMTERATLAGGHLSAGRRADGAFAVEASLPYDGGASTESLPITTVRSPRG
ncbi:hypothetical protein GCM10025780_07180 [Frondihabitans cladoniiphilus]|uniref:histidine kinase n=1 Tax=Frondihabitans cladoniiphilus TaxID=715785 RepID=A0ABP8VN60_9MICO